MVQVQINKKQAQAFAQVIFDEIEMYIAIHMEEFKLFLIEEEKASQLREAENAPN